MKKGISLIWFIVFFILCSYSLDKFILKEEFDKTYNLIYEVNGVFTGLGNKEKLYFYQKQNGLIGNQKKDLGIEAIICCIYDEKENIIESFKIPYTFTLPFSKIRNLNHLDTNEFKGRLMINDYLYGFTDDLNLNGRDEIYLYSLTGSYFYPFFFEFDIHTKEFKKILDYDGAGTVLFLEKIDKENIRIQFHGYGVGVNQAQQETIIYDWDYEKNKFIVSSRERY